MIPNYLALLILGYAAVVLAQPTTSPPAPLDLGTRTPDDPPYGTLVCSDTPSSAKALTILIESLTNQFYTLGPEIEPRTRCYSTDPNKCSAIPLSKKDVERGSANVELCGEENTPILCTGMEIVATRVMEDCKGYYGKWVFPSQGEGKVPVEIVILPPTVN